MDVLARSLAEHMKVTLGQPIVVENVSGAGGTIGSGRVAKAAPDGYMLVISGSGTHAAVEQLYPNPPYRALDFESVGLINTTPVVIVGKRDLPPNTLQEVVDYARARPGEVNHLTAGILAYSHIDFLMLQKRTGIKLVAIPLRAGAGGGQIDLINGAVQIALQNAATVTPLVKAGKLKALAVTSEQRLPVLPDVPTFKEAGFEGLGTNAWNAMFAPRAVPKEILDTMTAAVTEILGSGKAVTQLEELQFTVQPTRSLDEARDWLTKDIAHWTPIVAEAKTMVDKTQ